MSALLEFKDLSYWYRHNNKQHDIVKKINVSFNKGLFYAIVGPSGSGKTTLLALASALDAPKDGQVFIRRKRYKKNWIHHVSK